MTVQPEVKILRDKNLDDLKGAVDHWTKKEQERIENEVKFMREVLKGRGVSGAAEKNLAEATQVAVASIDSFLTGEQ